MSNLTDPLARPVHGTDPQNIIEYITRQKIYDSQFWKEECFGLSAADVTEKAARRIDTIGGSYGPMVKPTRFLSFVLKILQIQPEDEIVEEWIHTNEDLKYVRALGAFYIRLTGRPHQIYTWLEPLLTDSRKLRCREATSWSIIHMDGFVYDLLTKDRVLGIALPRLPSRIALEEAGYLDEPRESPLGNLSLEEAENMLEKMANDGCAAAIEAGSLRRQRLGIECSKDPGARNNEDIIKHDIISDREDDLSENVELSSNNDKQKRKRKKKQKFGSLFKSSKSKTDVSSVTKEPSSIPKEGSDEYWNEERAKLGLKPLK